MRDRPGTLVSIWWKSVLVRVPQTKWCAQAASFLVYILSGIFGLGFIATFVICIVSLMLDFWTVRVGAICRSCLVLCALL